MEALEMLRGEGDASAQVTTERRLVLLDLNMPKMSGIEFQRELRADPELISLPVVALTISNEGCDRI